jgi:hypothetical protein
VGELVSPTLAEWGLFLVVPTAFSSAPSRNSKSYLLRSSDVASPPSERRHDSRGHPGPALTRITGLASYQLVNSDQPSQLEYLALYLGSRIAFVTIVGRGNEHSVDRVVNTLLTGFARMLSLVDTTRGGLYGAETAGECVAD